MHLVLIKVTKDLRQDRFTQSIAGTWKKGDGCNSYNGDLSGWIEHFKGQGVKTYLKHKHFKCTLYREILESDKDWLAMYPIYAVKVLATELSSVEGYVYPRKG